MVKKQSAPLFEGSEDDLRELLDREAARFNTPDFIAADPVQFPRRFEDLRDIEITALLTAVISWGKRTMILRDAERMLAMMEHQPYNFLMEGAYEAIDPDRNIHRTFFGRDMQWMMRMLHEVYRDHESLDAFAATRHVGDTETPSWRLAEILGNIGFEANHGKNCAQCVPTNLRTTALKRLNMALRWLVRDDGIVDMGVWRSIPKSKLFIPMDVHVGNTARSLGLLTRKANDRKSTEELTGLMRTLRPDDPCLFDYALFGIEKEKKK